MLNKLSKNRATSGAHKGPPRVSHVRLTLTGHAADLFYSSWVYFGGFGRIWDFMLLIFCEIVLIFVESHRFVLNFLEFRPCLFLYLWNEQ